MTTSQSEVEHKEPAFKVVDKRRFTDQGDERSDVSLSSPVSESAAKVTSGDAPPVPPREADAAVHGPITFSIFMHSLAQQTLMALGALPWPDTGLVRQDLMQARQTIDVMAMLHEKTKGNLASDEARLCESLLYELRMVYLQTTTQKPT